MQSANHFEGLIFLLACSVHFVRRRFWAIFTQSQRGRPNCRWTKCTEHVSQKIRPSKRLELYIFQRKGPPKSIQERQGVPARWGDPARGIPTPKPPTARENHEPGPPLEPGPLAPCPFPNRCRGGGVPAGRGGGPIALLFAEPAIPQNRADWCKTSPRYSDNILTTNQTHEWKAMRGHLL